MVRVGSVAAVCLLVAAAPACAQNSDIFREDAPPAPATPGHDPFQMAPANPAPAPKPPPRPHPVPESEPAPVVVALPPPPAPSFDGVYTGEVTHSATSSGNCNAAPFTRTLTVKGNQLSYQSTSLITGPVNSDGTVTAYANNRSGMLTGKIQGGEFIGHVITGAGICHLDLRFQKQHDP